MLQILDQRVAQSKQPACLSTHQPMQYFISIADMGIMAETDDTKVSSTEQ